MGPGGLPFRVTNEQSRSVPNSVAQSASSASSGVKQRGKAINNTLNNFRVRQGGQKPRIEILPGMLRPVGKWSSQFATETKFDIDLHIPHVERAVTRFLGQRFREFHCRMHKYYKRAGSDRRRCEKPYDGVSQEDWEIIITLFKTDKFKDKMLEIKSRLLEEGSEPMTEDEIAEMVLGKKPCYNRGHGHGVESISSSSAHHISEVEELRRRAEAAERHAHESKQRVEELIARLVDTDLRVKELQSWKTSSEAKLEFLM
ncbi:hypothetical protein IFM89_025072 [Coptis chinensis]|uniref:Uncharacterized protein n=1 Tax=Coptis chinensis TaxID=261450 RepID=A0A835LSD4_9MAGN|nr:hypothetical protein IFM89_025072 [Coptis chinensis]